MGGGGVSDGYEGSKRPRMIESNPYFAVTAGSPLDVSKRARMMEPAPPYFGAMGSSAAGGTSAFYQPYGTNLPGAGANSAIQNFPGVRLRGLPFDCDDLDICKFFVGLDIVDCLLVHKNGRFTGEAFVVFPSAMQAEAMMGGGGVSDGYEGSKRPRMIESNPYFAVTAGSPLDVSKRARMMEPAPPYFGAMGSSAAGGTSAFYQPYGANLPGAGANSAIQNFPGVRLRGLPFDCDDLDIFKFFVGLDIVDCLLVHKNGRFTGEAFVVFPSAMQAEFALHRNRQNMGRRWYKEDDGFIMWDLKLCLIEPLSKIIICISGDGMLRSRPITTACCRPNGYGGFP
ncbi:hypothetical protein OsJ_32850 [Oryza sativa Japonica Group]|uniref:RRM domain-containing protein n=1 Tax=Oryza sativa subsp. japonica TaxID=39947 RepID=B9G991_ORYSJ|nr:hypothetical protein OsJ_32850 [Oryza sativa Japonica Group]